MLGSFAFIAYVYTYLPDPSLNEWASHEALERIRRREMGLPVELGASYSEERFKSELIAKGSFDSSDNGNPNLAVQIVRSKPLITQLDD